jgi:uncharacterized membrane protein
MSIMLANFSWMGFNIFLALVAVLFGWLLKGTSHKLLRFLYGIVWIIFLPNTLYLLTDISHLFETLQWVKGFYKMLLIFQYLVLLLIGITTYFLAVYPVEKVLSKSMQWHKTGFIIIVSILVGFGITLGRIERINSWSIVSNAPEVIHASVQLLVSSNLLLLICLYSIISMLMYLFTSVLFQRGKW